MYIIKHRALLLYIPISVFLRCYYILYDMKLDSVVTLCGVFDKLSSYNTVKVKYKNGNKMNASRFTRFELENFSEKFFR